MDPIADWEDRQRPVLRTAQAPLSILEQLFNMQISGWEGPRKNLRYRPEDLHFK